MTTPTAEVINLNNGVELPVIGLGVFQSPPEAYYRHVSHPG
jgi:hypothetical protein